MTAAPQAPVAAVEPYRDSLDHVADELRRLDSLITECVREFRSRPRVVHDAAPGGAFYISHDEVDLLLSDSGAGIEDSRSYPPPTPASGLDIEIRARVAESMRCGIFLPLAQLAQIFNLSAIEIHTIVVCLAPELHRKYDKLYAYLQDDISRKKPSIDLVLALLQLSGRDRWAARGAISESSALFQARIIHTVEDIQSPSGSSDLARFLKLDPRILNHILMHDAIDTRLMGIARVEHCPPDGDTNRFGSAASVQATRLVESCFSGQQAARKRMIVYLRGPYGAGKHELAQAVCSHLRCPLIRMDAEVLCTRETEAEGILEALYREALLLQAAVYLDHFDYLLEQGPKMKSVCRALSRFASDYGWLTFLGGEKRCATTAFFSQEVFHEIPLGVPGPAVREAVWRAELSALGYPVKPELAEVLAAQFRLTPRQIWDARHLAVKEAAMNAQSDQAPEYLFPACRRLSNQAMGELAVLVEPRSQWSDLVLPDDKIACLREICSQARHRRHVFENWGFDGKQSRGKGLSALFFGPPGTGKTMAAEVVAHELQLDLYKIDLSGVVSKYIGETEKNLSRIFREAETANAILFFDEADALFGKRTEITDAHDRYANVEVSHLLQKMEEYEGIAILASNLRSNMDEAFLRRIRFVIEFPFPDLGSRLQLWKSHVPPEMPCEGEIDFQHLAARFQIAGGSIRNVVLNGAFLAAADGGGLAMRHLTRAMQREYEKIGKLWMDGAERSAGKV